MTPNRLQAALVEFTKEYGFVGKGPLSVALVVTQHAREQLPLDPAKLVTEGGGQVLGLGKNAVQAVLKKHGITRVLASEGGRTSRGSLKNMREYVDFLNVLHADEIADLEVIELYWIAQVHAFFAGKPFRVRFDISRGLRAIIGDLLVQAEERQRKAAGVYYAGAVLQHLVGAKLDCVLGKGRFDHNSFSTADAPSLRHGDFSVGDVAVHVTTSPSEGLLGKCVDNLNNGLRPIIVTTRRGATLAEGLADNQHVADRVDVFEIEQFISTNLYELGTFAADGRRIALAGLIERYNEIVEEFETDPSLKIDLRS